MSRSPLIVLTALALASPLLLAGTAHAKAFHCKGVCDESRPRVGCQVEPIKFADLAAIGSERDRDIVRGLRDCTDQVADRSLNLRFWTITRSSAWRPDKNVFVDADLACGKFDPYWNRAQSVQQLDFARDASGLPSLANRYGKRKKSEFTIHADVKGTVADIKRNAYTIGYAMEIRKPVGSRSGALVIRSQETGVELGRASIDQCEEIKATEAVKHETRRSSPPTRYMYGGQMGRINPSYPLSGTGSRSNSRGAF